MHHFSAFVAEMLNPQLRSALDVETPDLAHAVTLAGDERDRAELERAIELGAASGVFTVPHTKPLDALRAAGVELRPSASGVHASLSSKAHAESFLKLPTRARSLIQSLAFGPGLGASLAGKCATAAASSVRALKIAQNKLAKVSPLVEATGLVELTLRPNGVKPSSLAKLAALPLQRLLVTDSIGDALPTLLPALSSLRRLVLASCTLDAAALVPITATSVTSLDLSGNKLRAKDLATLSGLTTVRELAVSRIALDRPATRALAEIAELRCLTAHSCNLDAACLTEIASITTLQSLDVANNPDLELRGLAKARELLRLNVTGCGGKLRGVEGLAALRTLLCSSDDLTDGELARLRDLTSLVSLVIEWGSITATGAAHLRALGALRLLSLAGNRIGPAGLASVAKLTALRVLAVSAAGLDATSVEALKDLHELRALELGGNVIGDAGVDLALRLPKLERLYLHVTGTTDAGAKRLAALQGLRELSLVGNELTKQTRAVLVKSLPNCRLELG